MGVWEVKYIKDNYGYRNINHTYRHYFNGGQIKSIKKNKLLNFADIYYCLLKILYHLYHVLTKSQHYLSSNKEK